MYRSVAVVSISNSYTLLDLVVECWSSGLGTRSQRARSHHYFQILLSLFGGLPYWCLSKDGCYTCHKWKCCE
jgi:hypothetical protein